MFEKTLQDVVRGIRKTKRDKPKFIQQCIDEIKAEISSADMFVKANALQKLTFFQMMGYSMNWASFATIEVMSSPRFSQKRVGYLGAVGHTACVSTQFQHSLFFRYIVPGVSTRYRSYSLDYESVEKGASRSVFKWPPRCLQCWFGSELLIQYCDRRSGQRFAPRRYVPKDKLLPPLLISPFREVTHLTAHPQPYLRKKAVLVLFKMFVRYPEGNATPTCQFYCTIDRLLCVVLLLLGLRLTFHKLQKCMDDPNSAVVSCAVNVITELSDKNPKNYLSLAPSFFQLLSRSSNNWMLIKVVKLLGSLVPEEPRLAR